MCNARASFYASITGVGSVLGPRLTTEMILSRDAGRWSPRGNRGLSLRAKQRTPRRGDSDDDAEEEVEKKKQRDRPRARRVKLGWSRESQSAGAPKLTEFRVKFESARRDSPGPLRRAFPSPPAPPG